jgi:hypothetical protein
MGISLSAAWIDDPISIGNVSFEAAQWDNVYNISTSRQKVAQITNNNKAVVLYLFEACFT